MPGVFHIQIHESEVTNERTAMTRRRKTFSQQLRNDFRKNHRLHQQGMDLLRGTQSLKRQVKAMLAPRLDLRFAFAGLTLFPKLLIKSGFKKVVAKIRGDAFIPEITREDFTATFELFCDAIEHVAVWARFWFGMLLDWLWDETRNVFTSVLYMILTLVGYLLGAWLLLAIIYFVLTH